MKDNNQQQIKDIKRKHIVVIALIVSIISIIIGTLIGLINFDFSKLHLVVRGLIWITNVFISYLIVFLFCKLLKIRFKFFDEAILLFSYTFSVTLVMIISGKFVFLYVTSYLSVATIITIIRGIYKFYKSRKK